MTTPTNDTAFDAGVAAVGDPLEIPPTRKRRTKKIETPQPQVTAQAATGPEVSGFVVPPEQIRAGIEGALIALARRTQTAPPAREEVEGLANSLSYGLAHTKIGVSEKSGPWAPLMIVASVYILPRAIERVFAVIDKRNADAEAQRRAAASRFQRATDAASPAPAKEGSEGPIPAVGARDA